MGDKDNNELKGSVPARELGLAKEVGYKGKVKSKVNTKAKAKGKRSSGAFHEVREEEESHRPMRHPREK